MRDHAAYWVVAGWGAWNALLLAVLGIYGENGLVFWLWGGVVALLEVAALAVLASARRGSEEQTAYQAPVAGTAGALPAAVAVGLVAFGFAYGMWLLAVAVPLFGVAAALRSRPVRADRED
jgi:hypothetical protein